MKNLSYAVSAALFIVWMSRKGNVPSAQQAYASSRWGLFFKALSGELVLTGTRASTGTGTATGSTKPATTAPAPTPATVIPNAPTGGSSTQPSGTVLV